MYVYIYIYIDISLTEQLMHETHLKGEIDCRQSRGGRHVTNRHRRIGTYFMDIVTTMHRTHSQEN